MAYFAYEAYLNLVGPRIDAESWKDEREFFSKAPYKGTQGKLRSICEKIGIEVDHGRRPYQTIRNLGRLRDFLAHGKLDAYAFEMDVGKGKDPDMFRDLQIYKMVNRENADRALKDTEELIEFLHAAVTAKRVGNDTLFKSKALKFPLAFASGGQSTHRIENRYGGFFY